MAQIEVKVKLDLPPGVELLGYERCGAKERCVSTGLRQLLFGISVAR